MEIAPVTRLLLFRPCTIRVISGKEIVATLDLFLPRSEMFKMDAKLNVTLPSFVPMIFTTKIEEKKSREYDVSRSRFL